MVRLQLQQKSVFLSTVANELILTERHLTVLLNVLRNHSPAWSDIGVALGFTNLELNVISSAPSLFTTAPVSYLTRLLSQWVQWPTTDHPTKPTLGVLCAALRGAVVGLGSLSKKIEEEVIRSTAGN